MLERYVRNVEVVGSTPITSTRERPDEPRSSGRGSSHSWAGGGGMGAEWERKVASSAAVASSPSAGNRWP